MDRAIIKHLLFSLLTSALFLAAGPAIAGPGGGTYYANSPAGGLSGTALRKFVDSLPGVGPNNKNNLGSYIPIAQPITGKPGVPADGDYYEIGLVEYAQKMHSDLPKKTRLRGYRDLSPTFANMSTQYLGPLIIASKDRPVRVKFTNMLPTGSAGNLFIPVDTTIMGAGMGPYTAAGGACDPAAPGAPCAMFTENRATLHLHGGNTPWISDGTPNQWTAPVGETSVPLQMRKGVSARDVPDMPASGDGSLTFFWTNQQSNRLMFYHDHAYGLTRLNVYAGEAAGYLLTDPVEDGLIASGVVPGRDMVNAGHPEYKYGIPLIIQDKTFVPQNIAVQDAKWTNPQWGTYGDLWFPHVYEPNQDPTSPGGANPFGRWDYGPWFWPPVVITDPAKQTLPEVSTTPEAFMDTPVINGAAYPYLTVEPKPYRFRILNACNDRTLNLSLFYADPSDPSGKEVKMVPAGPNATFPPTWPTDGRDGGVPDPALAGPSMIQIGSEGGFLPAPVLIPPTPIGYEYNRRNIVVLNVANHALFMGAAERADVIIDFSQVPPGSTLILYNDGPAPNPAFDSRYDYFTGDPDQTVNGGAPSTLRGYGPNMRTIMQFRVAGAPSSAFNLGALQTALPTAFKASQPAPLVPQSTYPVASGGNAPTDLYAKIQDYSFTFNPVGSTIPTTIPFQAKAIQELWDPYGRMNATLGVELPFTSNLTQTTVPMGYAEPVTETIIDGQPQIWKITHNGVDTHPVHFHMVNVQLINRVGWDGAIRPPDPNEIGWKETIRMNPLEDAIVALIPKNQTLPNTWAALNPDNNGLPLPASKRPIDPTMPPTALIATTLFPTPATSVAGTVPNVPVADPLGYDYGYEYVWHCHILGHEENDFMRPMVFTIPLAVPPAPTALNAYLGGITVPGKTSYVTSYVNPSVNQIVLQWMDGSTVAPSSFRIERSVGGGAYQTMATMSFLSGFPPIYTDTSVAPGTTYSYRIFAFNSMGDSVASNIATVATGTWTAATGLTVTPSKPTPHVVGTNVQFTALGTGATTTVPNTTAAYQYRFWLNNGSGKVMVQDYGFGSSWALPDNTPVGNYTITVDVRTSSSVAFDVTTSLSYQVVPPPNPPVTVASPVPGIYTTPPVTVTLAATTLSPPATIYYTTDGTLPTTASAKYTAPIVVNATTIINYFAVDVNGAAEAVHSDTWYIHSADLVASVMINNGATVTNNANVILTLSAVDPSGVATMQFSNDGITYTAEEPFASTKAWNLAPGGGLKTVFVRFRDKSLPSGFLYPPVTASITLDSLVPTTTASPIPGVYSTGPVNVTLTADKPAIIYYTIDGSMPTTASAVYIAPIPVTNIAGASTTINFFAVDPAGNTEVIKSGTWVIHTQDMVASVNINNGAVVTNTLAVTLGLGATDPAGVASMQFSNDGVNWSAEEPYAATKAWTLSMGDGVKSVYARFRDKTLPTGNLYAPITASITLDTTPPVTTAGPIAGVYSLVPVSVTLTTNEQAIIYYTTDGSAPTMASTRYMAPISIAVTTTLKYFAIDAAGNIEAVNSGTWTVHSADMVASVNINNGSTLTNSTAVALTLNAVDPSGVAYMQFSNDGVNYSTEESFATAKSWALAPGDGVKTVYVRFRDKTLPMGNLYPPVTTNITLDTTPPVTTAGPISGTYAAAPISVTLSTNETAIIHFTVDGTTPTAASAIYSAPIPIYATTTIKYFAVDTAGNVEAVKLGTWAIHVPDMTASVKINNGASFTTTTAVSLTLSAVDPLGIAGMEFSNDGVSYSAEEPYATGKGWMLTPGDGPKTVYVRFRDSSHNGGVLYDPVIAGIILDTTPPITNASPIPGTYADTAISVTLMCNDQFGVGCDKIYYTTDGTTPTTASAVYFSPITVTNVPGASTNIKYLAVDLAGNAEAVRSGTWTMHANDLNATVQINSGVMFTKDPAVTLSISATDPSGIATMQFSNDGASYSAEEPFATTKSWTLDPVEGLKTVYVRFRDKSLPAGTLYPPITATILMGTKDGILPGTSSYLASAVKALRIAGGMMTAAPLDLVHGDVAPYRYGTARPDGKIDLLDAYVILQRQLGLISGF
jgi:FtsP/CotA-like multicopper oxidase with cupredoxin domain